MKVERVVIDRAVDAVYDRVEAALADRGWLRRPGGPTSRAVYTSARPDGLLATISVSRPVFSWPARWPERLRLEYGVGYEPALDLAPLLTLPSVSLLGREVESTELTGEDEIDSTAARIVARCERSAVAFRDTFTGIAAVETAVDEVHQRLLILLATGRRDETRTLLEDYAGDPEHSHDRRFVRQVRRRLNDESLPVPPFDLTMAQLPRPRFEAPSWEKTKAISRAQRAARSAVRRQRRGRTPEELARSVVEEMNRRGVEPVESAVAIEVAMLMMQQRPFGRVSSGLAATRTVGSALTGVVRQIRGTAPGIPEWLQPPHEATYRIPNAVGENALAVEVDRAAGPFLDRILDPGDGQEGSRGPADRLDKRMPLPRMVLLDAVVAADDTGIVAVRLGTTRVGTLSVENSLYFQPYLAAARLFDEQAIVGATVCRPSREHIIELRRPAPVEG